MKLLEEFKVYENMWDTTPVKTSVKESTETINEQEVDACLERINSKGASPEIEKDWYSVNVHLSKEDLKKALRIGNDAIYDTPNRGKTIPAQLVDEAFIAFEPASRRSHSCITFQLAGEHPVTDESVHDYLKDLPWIGKIIMAVKFVTTEEAKKYFETEILPSANKLAHDIIEGAWNAGGYSDYQGITDYKASRVNSTSIDTRPLTESRSIADIEADIARLQQELADAKAAEKKASYGGNIPTDVWYWDIYLDPSEKGTWTSIDDDLVYETEDAALNGAYNHLSELDYEDELEYDSDDYYVEAVKIPVSQVPIRALEWSGLDYLIED